MTRQPDPRLLARLRDDRGGRVVFLSHCLLDENVRYLGGAFHSGAVPEATRLTCSGIGVCQLPCPEQRAWGGVHKPMMMLAYGLRDSPLYAFRRPLFRLFVAYTRLRYWLLARHVAHEIDQYHRAGIEVAAVVGVGASPSCGVNSTLDLGRSFGAVAGCPLARIDRDFINRCVAESCRPGEGLFTRALRSRIRRRGLTPRFLEHDLIAEMQGADRTPGLEEVLQGAAPDEAGRARTERGSAHPRPDS